jgi:hypothetical protein
MAHKGRRWPYFNPGRVFMTGGYWPTWLPTAFNFTAELWASSLGPVDIPQPTRLLPDTFAFGDQSIRFSSGAQTWSGIDWEWSILIYLAASNTELWARQIFTAAGITTTSDPDIEKTGCDFSSIGWGTDVEWPPYLGGLLYPSGTNIAVPVRWNDPTGDPPKSSPF